MDSGSVIPDLIRDRNDKNSKCVVLLIMTQPRSLSPRKRGAGIQKIYFLSGSPLPSSQGQALRGDDGWMPAYSGITKKLQDP